MVAVAAFIAFLIGLIIVIIDGANLTGPAFWTLLGLTLLAFSRVYDHPLGLNRRDT